jgi:alginate export protein
MSRLPTRLVTLTCVLLMVFASRVVAESAPAPTPSRFALPRMEMEGPWNSTWRLEVYNRLRGEFVDWFQPKPTSPTPNFRYNFLDNKFQIGLRVTRAPFELFLQFQDSTLGFVPADAVGVGATYFANTMSSTQNGAIFRNGWISAAWPLAGETVSVKAGRELYSSGSEVPIRNASLKWIQANRISQRFIGPFDYTAVGRSFDGGQLAVTQELLTITGFGFKPTFGGYEVDANPELEINLAGVAVSLADSAGARVPWLADTMGGLSWYYYEDFRDIVFLDNRPLSVRQQDRGMPAKIHTVGAYAARLFPLGPGAIDTFAYGYGQTGEWQSQTDLAWAYGAETGYRVAGVWAQPWLRAGINSGSGDTNPNDNTHGTLFQLLPTAWLYAMFPFYNMMNNQDVFAQAILQPDPRLSFRLDFHWLRVNSGQDFAYFGGGATSNTFFGYGGVAAAGRYNLAYLTHLLLNIAVTDNLAFNVLYAHAWGQGVINANFAGTGGNYGYIESVLAF